MGTRVQTVPEMSEQEVVEGLAKVSVSDGARPSEPKADAAPEGAPAIPDDTPSAIPGMSVGERFNLCRSVGEECIMEQELRVLCHKKPEPICYDGFEPSGRMHIAQGVQKSISVNKLTAAGCRFKFWVADWFALLNNKMGGDLKKIRVVGQYMIEVWKACGMDMSKVDFIWSSDEINANSNEYWLRVMDICRKNSLTRLKRCGQIMGREEADDMPASQIMYPAMQCADIFHLKADICQLGMDQRKVNMLAREYCSQAKIKFKPVILSHKMLAGLKEGQEKMSKRDPLSAIFMEDTEQDVKTKIKKAFCPPQIVEKNPCLEYVQYLVIPKLGGLQVRRSEENGGDKNYTDFAELSQDYSEGKLHPGDLKAALAAGINEILKPVRDHFTTNAEAKALLTKVKGFMKDADKK